MNTELSKNAKNDFEKDFFNLVNDAVFGNTKENIRNLRDYKLTTTEVRRKYLVIEPNYTTTKILSENLLAIEMKRTQILMNKPVYQY